MSARPEVSALASSMPRSRGRAGFVVLFALAWFQVAFASHQFEHVTGDLFDVCTACKNFERHDAAVAEIPAEIEPAATPPLLISKAVSPNVARALRNYRSRAPPSV
jgi:hypothetical protein